MSEFSTWVAMHKHTAGPPVCPRLSGDGYAADEAKSLDNRALTRLIETSGRRCGLAGMAVSQVVALRGPGGLVLDPPAGRLWPGFLTTCRLAGFSPWRGSKEGAPRGAVVPDGGERPLSPRRRSGGVKLEAA